MARFRCTVCGETFPNINTPCPTPGCTGGRDTYVRETSKPARGISSRAARAGEAAPDHRLVRLSTVSATEHSRVLTGITEFDRAVGGGLVKGTFILLAGEPGAGKCVVGSTRVLDPLTGSYNPISELTSSKGSVLAFDEGDGYLKVRPTRAFHTQGSKPVVRLTTRLGRELRCTPDHPLLTPDGWRAASELTPGMRVASPRSLPYFGSREMPIHQVKLIAYILSDGHVGADVGVTTSMPEIVEDLRSLAVAFSCSLKMYPALGDTAMHRFTVPRGERAAARLLGAKSLQQVALEKGLSWARWAREALMPMPSMYAWAHASAAPSANQVTALADVAGVEPQRIGASHWEHARRVQAPLAFIREIGMGDSRAATKRVPAQIFELTKDQLRVFLRVLFSCDGSVYIPKSGGPGLSYSTISRGLAEDVQHLLLRFGLVTRLRTKSQRVNGKPYTAYEIVMTGADGVSRFLDEIGIMGRTDAQQTVRSMANTPKGRSTHFDTVPLPSSFWTDLRLASDGASKKSIQDQAGVLIQHNRRPGRPLTRRVLEALDAAYPLLRISTLLADVYWDEIANVEPDGEEMTYDLSVEPQANFVANDLIVHNSTIAIQVTDALVKAGHEAIYITGEESPAQIRLRAERLGLDLGDLRVLAETDASVVAATIVAERPMLAIIDSVQTLVVPTSEGIAGGAAQIREVANLLLQTAKTTGTALILIGHVTKEGQAAGPETLQHLVDAVMLIEGDRFGFFRILRATKNRYGAIDEMGLFEMTDKGMIGVDSAASLQVEGGEPFGRVICPVFEGTRVILMEVQALVAKAAYSSPRRVSEGISEKRVAMLLAVLERYADLDLSGHDVYVRTSAGMAINDPAIDAAVCAAIASSYWSHSVEHTTAVFGEVALGGGIRPVRAIPSRAKESVRLQIDTLAGPVLAPGAEAMKGIKYLPAPDIKTLLDSLDLLKPKDAKPVAGRSGPGGDFFRGLKAGQGGGQ